MCSTPKIFYFKLYSFDLIPRPLSWRKRAEINCIVILKNLILSILTITFYSVYEYTARLNVTNGTVNLTGELIKNLECETRVSRVWFSGAFATGNSTNRNWIPSCSSFRIIRQINEWTKERNYVRLTGTMNQCLLQNS